MENLLENLAKAEILKLNDSTSLMESNVDCDAGCFIANKNCVDGCVCYVGCDCDNTCYSK